MMPRPTTKQAIPPFQAWGSTVSLRSDKSRGVFDTVIGTDIVTGFGYLQFVTCLSRPQYCHLLTEKLLLKLVQVRNTLALKQLHSRLQCSTLGNIFF